MPTYEYACRDCGEHLEVVQKFSDAALTECPACQGALRKVFGAVGIVLKGSGFYKTDSRGSKNGASSTSSESGASSSPGASQGGEGGSGASTTGSSTSSSSSTGTSSGSTSGGGSSGTAAAAAS